MPHLRRSSRRFRAPGIDNLPSPSGPPFRLHTLCGCDWLSAGCWAQECVLGSGGTLPDRFRLRISTRGNCAGCARSNGRIAEGANPRLHGSAGHEGRRGDNGSLGLSLRQWNDRHRCELRSIRRFGRQHQPILQREHRLCQRTGFSGQLLWADRRSVDCGRTVRIRGRWVCNAGLAMIDRQLGLEENRRQWLTSGNT
jgi:hypothetical protein